MKASPGGGDQGAVVALDTRVAGAAQQAGMQQCSNCSGRAAYSPVSDEVRVWLEASDPPAPWRHQVGHLFAPLSPSGPSGCQRSLARLLNMFDITDVAVVDLG